MRLLLATALILAAALVIQAVPVPWFVKGITVGLVGSCLLYWLVDRQAEDRDS